MDKSKRVLPGVIVIFLLISLACSVGSLTGDGDQAGLRIILVPDLPDGAYTVDDLRETANNIERRVNALGLAEATVQIIGENRILVELPGVTNRQQAIDTIQQTALLEFVDFGGLGSEAQQLVGQLILTDQQVEIAAGRATSEGAEATPDPEAIERLVHPRTGQPFTTIMTGSGLQTAAAEFDSRQGWIIRFELTEEGSAIFSSFTAARLNEPLAIVLDGEVLSAPVIQDVLTTGGVISGRFTEEEANTLALQLRSGALPIPLRVESILQTDIIRGDFGVSP